MRLAVFNTNVLISAGINAEGAPATLVMDWVFEAQVQLVTCPWIVEEYRQVARRKKFVAYEFPPLWLEFLIEGALSLPNPKAWPLAIPDPKDAPFLSLALTSGAWLVTGTLKHFPEKSRRNVTVIFPADYLAHLRVDSK